MNRPVDTVTSEERRRLYERAGAWDGTTLAGRLQKQAAVDGARPAVIDQLGARTRTYAELERDALRVAGFLRRSGVAPGDVVSVQLPNWYETVAVDLGVLLAGGVLNPMLPIYRAREMTHMLGVGGARVLFTPGRYRGFDYEEMVEGFRGEVPALAHHVAVESGTEPFAAWPELDPSEIDLRADRVSELMFSSGTEARPKAVMHTEQTAGFSARSAAAALGLRPDDVVWMPSPIGHSTGLNYGVRIALHHGLPLVLQDHWSPPEAADLVRRFGCTYTVAATTFLSDLVEVARAEGLDLSSLRLFGSGGAPVPAELVAAAGHVGVTVLRLYGSTEVLVATWNRPDSPLDRLVATDGRPLDGVEIEVRNAAGSPVGGEPGEIFVRGPATGVGFFADPERTAATFSADGWVRSGDLGILHDDGYLQIVGRKKEIIIRGGLNIAPREVEEMILALPGVAAVAVVGLPDARLGELACACVVPAPGAAVTLSEVVSALRDKGLAPYKLPERLELVDALPTTPTGKIQKFRLVEAFAETSSSARSH